MGNVSNLLMLKNDAACKRRYNVMFFLIMKISLLQIFLKCPNFEVVLPTPGYTTSSDPAISHVFVLLILS